MTTERASQVQEHPLNPPGGVMVWLFIYMELLVFGIAFIAFFYLRSQDISAFRAAQGHLDQTLGLCNTLLLITSGWLVALANRAYKEERHDSSSRLLVFAMLLGVAFLVVKGIEYAPKIAMGYTTGTSTFFDFYWLLTAFHAAHILLGLPLLLFMALKIKRRSPFDPEGFTIQTGSAYWHMCDLIWVLLFPVLYLL